MDYNIGEQGGSIQFTIYNLQFTSPRQRLGFSLAEIVIVLGIIGVLISAVIPMFLNTITAGRSATHYSTAYKIADSKIEEYRNSNFDEVFQETATIDELPNGSRTTTIDNVVDGNPEQDIKKVTLEVNWQFKRPQQIKIVTYIYRGGL